MLDLIKQKIQQLSDCCGNGFYILDSDKFESNYSELTGAFKNIYPNFNIAYSYKTNYTPKLCKIVNRLGGYAEVVSDMELEIALRCGVKPCRIIWNGPIKNSDAVAKLLLSGGTVNLDSAYEFDSIRSLAQAYPDNQLNIGIRCNFDVGDGVVSRFGFDVDGDDFGAALNLIKTVPNLHLVNLQCHFAKRNVEYWNARAAGMVKVADYAASVLGYMPDRIDIGGGLYGHMDDALKAQFSTVIPCYSDYANAAATVFAKRFPNGGPQLLIEPGSALAGDCMRFVARVETIKTVRGKTFATVYGSQKNISMSGVNPPIHIIDTGSDVTMCHDADIVGYTCIESDVLYHGYSGRLSVGDYVVFSNCGSYSLVMKPPFIFPNFPVVDICRDDLEVIKRAECFDDIFHTFNF